MGLPRRRNQQVNMFALFACAIFIHGVVGQLRFLPPLCVLSHLPLHFVFVSRHIRCKKQARDHHRHAVGSSIDMVTYYSRVVDAWLEKRIR